MSNIVLCATCEYTQADFDRIKANGGEPLIIDKCTIGNSHFYWVGDKLTNSAHEQKERKTWLVWRKSWKWNPEGDLKEMYSCDIDAYGVPPEEHKYYCFFNMYVEKRLHAVHI